MAPFLPSLKALGGIAFLIATTPSVAKKHILLDESFPSALPPIESRDYMLTRSNWLGITPECDQGTVQSEEETEGPGAWSILTNNGDQILCTNTVASDQLRPLDDDDRSGSTNDSSQFKKNSGCFLSYKVLVRMQDGVEFTFDIEYDIQEGSVRRQVHSFQTVGLKSKVLSPLIKPNLIKLMQEENRRLTRIMNPHDLASAKIFRPSVNEKSVA